MYQQIMLRWFSNCWMPTQVALPLSRARVGAGNSSIKKGIVTKLLQCSSLTGGHTEVTDCTTLRDASFYTSSVATGRHVSTLPQPCRVMGFEQIRRGFLAGGRGRWTTDSATNLRRKAFDSCKTFVYIRPQMPTGAPPLDPTGGLSFPRPPLPTMTSEPGYATVLPHTISMSS